MENSVDPDQTVVLDLLGCLSDFKNISAEEFVVTGALRFKQESNS